LSKTRKSKQHLWPRARASRDAELDEALRALGEDVLNQEIPERLLRVLRAARDPDNTRDADEKGKQNAP
jgi:hypothetical protein